jgi:hypothetical protein
MLLIISALCMFSAIGMLICSIGFGRKAKAYQRSRSVTFFGTTEAEALKMRLVKRIQHKRRIEVDPNSNVSLRHGMKTGNVRTANH